MRVSAAAAVAALLLIACSGSSSSVASSSRASTPRAAALASTRAADLRTRLDVLLGEHALIVAKETSAAASDTDEYPGYVLLLAANAKDLQDLLRPALGNTAAGDFAREWSLQDKDLVEYAVGLVTHKQSQADASAQDLTNAFVPTFARLVGSLTQMPVELVARLVTQQLAAIESVIGDIAGQGFAQRFTDLHFAYLQTSQIGDAMALRIAQMFPDKFPGDPTPQPVATRVALSMLLQEHSYLATTATDSLIRGRASEAPAINTALADSVNALGAAASALLGATASARLGQALAGGDSELLQYAADASQTASEALAQAFAPQFARLAGVSPNLVGYQVGALVKVVDDQRTKAFDSLAADDRSAATAMEPIADAMVAAG